MLKTLMTVVVMLAVTSAASMYEEEREGKLTNLLKRLLNLEVEERGYCQDNAKTVECNGGKCGGGENPNEWSKGNYYCYKCPSPTGGFQCELSDPCSGNPCALNPKKTECKPNSFYKLGYYCKKPRKVTTRSELFENLNEHADQPQYNEIRELILLTGDVDEAIMEATKRATRRMLEE